MGVRRLLMLLQDRVGDVFADPAVFRQRLSTWQKRAISSGALEWRMLMDASKLPSFLTAAR